MPWTVFLDRDGTLVPNRHYPVRPDQLTPYAGAPRALRTLARAGASLVLVSNQSAVGRGLLTRAGLRTLDEALQRRFRGVNFAATYYCPHLPGKKGPACTCRKPRPGMVLRGLQKTKASPKDSFLIGDSWSDMQAGRRAGVTTVMVLTGSGRRDRGRAEARGWVDKVTRNVETASAWILRQRQG